MKVISLLRFVLGLILICSANLIFAQTYPTVFFNKFFRGTGSGYTTSSNSITVGSQIVGENFRFIGSIAGSTFTSTGNNVTGSIVYTNADGNQVTLTNGTISSVGPSGNTKEYFNFFVSSSESYVIINPRFDATNSGSSTYSFNASSPLSDLNSFLSAQTVVTVTANLSGFTSCFGSASAAQSFTVSGTNLSANVNVSAPTGFEVSLSSGSGYGSSVSLTRSGTSLATTTVYIRLSASNAAGSYNGNLLISTTNSATKNLYAFGDVFTAPAITSQPTNATVCTGTAGTFSIAATGGNLSYQWQVNTGSGWTNLSDSGIYYGTTTSVLRFSNAVNTSFNSYQYRCVVSGSCTPSVTSNAVTLNVNATVSMQTQPTDVAICTGSSTSFNVSATGAGITYQWQVLSGGSWSNISNGGIYSGATTNTLTLTSPNSSQNNLQFRCVLTGTCSTLNSNPATLTINDVPAAPNAISGDLTICENTNQSYSVSAISGATSYTWTIPSGWAGTSSLRAINVTASTSGGNLTVKANNSCGSSSATQVTITVSNNPAPVVDFGVNSSTQCLSGNTFSFTNNTTTISGVTITSNTWNFGDSSTETSTNPTHTYASANNYSVSLRVVASNGCIASKSSFVQVNAAPTSTLSGTQTICSGSVAPLSVQLTGSQPWSITYSDGATSTTVNNITSSLYTLNVSPTTTKTFTIASITDANCSTSAVGDRSGSANVTVNPTVNASVSIASSDADNSVCSGTSVTFTATPTNGGSPTYTWQKNGIDISGATGSTYSVNSNTLLDDDRFSVQMTSNATCISQSVVFSNNISLHIAPAAPRTPAVITGETTQCALGVSKSYAIVEVLNATSYSWTVPTGWSIASGQGTIQAYVNVGSANQTGDVSVSASNGCGTSTAQILTITAVNASPSAPTGSSSQSFCSATSPTVASLTATGSSIKWYDSANLTNQLNSSTGLSTAQNYYATQTSSGCESPSLTVAVTVTTNPTISSTTAGSTCGAGTVNLAAIASAGTLNWYSASSGGSSLGTNSNYTTASISTTTTYYVDATLNSCVSTSRTAVIATVNSVPTISGTTPASICGSGTLSLQATASAGSVNWYDASTNGNLLASNTGSFTTPSISSNTTYFVQAVNNGCFSLSRTAVVATVLTIPTISSTSGGERCGTGTVSLLASASAGSVKWYSATSGGSALTTSTSFTTPSISSTTTYYVEAEDQGCVSTSRSSVIATVKAIPTITNVSSNTRCGDGSVTLGATASGGNLSWYSASSGGSSLGSSNSFTTPSLSNTTSYYVESTLNGCVSSRSEVIATVTQLPVVISGNLTDYDQVSLTASGGQTYLWDAGLSPNLASNTFDESGTYTVSVTNNSGCTTTKSVNVQIKLIGLDRYGGASEDNLTQLNRFGERNANNPIFKSGALKKYRKFKLTTSNLVLHLNAADSQSYSGSGTNWIDISSSSLTASLQNGVTFTRENGGQMLFDGTNDFVSIGSDVGVTNSMTLDCWINPSNVIGTKSIISQDGTSSGSYQLQLDGSNVKYLIQGQTGKTVNFTFRANQWVHLVTVFNQSANNVKFYVNGNLVNTETYTNVGSLTNALLKLGSYEGTTQFYSGSIGSIRIYSSALNDNQINANYQMSKDLYGL